MPHYICDAALGPCREAGVEILFYPIDKNLDPVFGEMAPGDKVLYVNYFGLKDERSAQIARKFGEAAVIDATQSFFIKGWCDSYLFNSARKFFGVADGAYLYSPRSLASDWPRNENPSTKHLYLRIEGRQCEAFAEYQRAENEIDLVPRRISTFSETMLRERIDYKEAMARRVANSLVYHELLASKNSLQIPLNGDAPFCYPFLPAVEVPRQALYSREIFPPQLWKDCLAREIPQWERALCTNLLPLPVDHRYGEAECRYVAKEVLACL